MTHSAQRRVYFTSDWHIGHVNVLIYDQRPFRDLDHMHTVLVNNYNATVRPDDICYFLGDMGLSKDDALQDVVSRLVGTKVLILGNHDKGAAAMYRMGFDVVMNSASLIIAGQHVTLSHCPLRGVWREDVSTMKGATEGECWHKESKHTHFSLPDFGQYHLHGHIHSGPVNDKQRIDGRQFDVGVAGNNYRPVSISAIESWIAKEEAKP